jgi:hypothetical protein
MDFQVSVDTMTYFGFLDLSSVYLNHFPRTQLEVPLFQNSQDNSESASIVEGNSGKPVFVSIAV